MYVFFNDPGTTKFYPLSLHDALPICATSARVLTNSRSPLASSTRHPSLMQPPPTRRASATGSPSAASKFTRGRRRRSEEHTSELQSRQYLVCRLLLDNKNKTLFHSHT